MADISKVIQTLKDEKVDEKSITDFVVSANNMLAQQIQIEIVTTLGETDFERLNAMNESTAHGEISKRYKEITGKSIEQKSDEMLDGFVTGFLTEYQKQKLQGKK
jgi:hypothetical protein